MGAQGSDALDRVGEPQPAPDALLSVGHLEGADDVHALSGPSALGVLDMLAVDPAVTGPRDGKLPVPIKLVDLVTGRAGPLSRCILQKNRLEGSVTGRVIDPGADHEAGRCRLQADPDLGSGGGIGKDALVRVGDGVGYHIRFLAAAADPETAE